MLDESQSKFEIHFLRFVEYSSTIVGFIVNMNFNSKILTLPAPHISENCIKIKINVNFYFKTFLWCSKIPNFYEGLTSVTFKILTFLTSF